MPERKTEIVILSDLHLGTYGCHARELLAYLKSISPGILILNGDIVDIWQFRKRYFPESHFSVIKEILRKMREGTRTYYITGNHDEKLRRFSDLKMDNFILTDKMVIEIDGKKAWIFHGDVFDISTKGSARLLAKLGGKGYDLLILLNRFVNFALQSVGKEKMSLSKKVKDSVKKAVSYISNFEAIAGDLAIENGYDYVICGHIHQPQKRVIANKYGEVVYLNSGDWVENLTALEYAEGEWHIYRHPADNFSTRVILKKEEPAIDVLTDKISFHLISL